MTVITKPAEERFLIQAPEPTEMSKATDRLMRKIGESSVNLIPAPDYERKGGSPEQYNTQDLMNIFKAHPWAYSAVFSIASTIAGLPWKGFAGDDPLPEDHALSRFLARPNPLLSGWGWKFQTMVYLETTGKAFSEIILAGSKEEQGARKKKKGPPEALFPIRPDLMRVIPHPKKIIGGFVFKPEQRYGEDRAFEPEDILYINYFDPINVTDGLSPLIPCMSALLEDLYARIYKQDFFKRGARLEGYIKTPEFLTDPQWTRMKAQFAEYQGAGKTRGTPVFDAGSEYVELSKTPHDSECVELQKGARAEILASYNVPPIMLALLERATWANAREQKRTYWEICIIPRLALLTDAFNFQIVPLFEKASENGAKKLRVDFDLSEVTALRMDAREQAEIFWGYIDRGVYSPNDVRTKLGEKTREGGDQYKDQEKPLEKQAESDGELTGELQETEKAKEPDSVTEEEQVKQATKRIQGIFKKQRQRVLKNL